MATAKEIREKARKDAIERAKKRAAENKARTTYKPTDTKIGPNMSAVNKPD
jgi:hypothetical protein